MGAAKNGPASGGDPVAGGDGPDKLDVDEQIRRAIEVDEVEQLRADAVKAIAAAEADTPVDPDPPVYDERGNVRPRGTEGAKPMTFAERKAIAKRLAAAEVVDDRTTPYAVPPKANPKQKEQDR